MSGSEDLIDQAYDQTRNVYVANAVNGISDYLSKTHLLSCPDKRTGEMVMSVNKQARAS